MTGWTHEDFFPYKAYRQEQRDLMRYIEMDARLGKNILLLAPNGTGKTVITLCSLLPIAIDHLLFHIKCSLSFSFKLSMRN